MLPRRPNFLCIISIFPFHRKQMQITSSLQCKDINLPVLFKAINWAKFRPLKHDSKQPFWKWWLKWVVSGWEASTQGSRKSSQMALVRGYCLPKGPLRLVAPFGRLWKRCSFPWHPDDWLPGSCVAWNGLFCTSRSLLPILIPSHKSASHRQAHRLWLSLLAKRSRWRYDELCRSPGDLTPTPNATYLCYHSFSVQKRNQDNTLTGDVWILGHDVWQV